MIIQAIGFIGVLCFIISFQFRSTKALLICQITGSSIFCLQFILLGAYIGAINLIVGILRNFLVINRDRLPWARSWLVCFGLIGICFASMAIFWNGYLSILPFLALAGSSIGYWTKNARNIRLSNLTCASPSWLVYDLLVGSWGGAANEIVTIMSALVSIYRYGWKQLGAAE